MDEFKLTKVNWNIVESVSGLKKVTPPFRRLIFSKYGVIFHYGIKR